MVTVLKSEHQGVAPRAGIVVKPDDSSEGSPGDPAVDAAALTAAKELLAAQTSQIRVLPGEVRAFVEELQAPLRLVICGAGHDAIPLVRAAAQSWLGADHRLTTLRPLLERVAEPLVERRGLQR